MGKGRQRRSLVNGKAADVTPASIKATDSELWSGLSKMKLGAYNAVNYIVDEWMCRLLNDTALHV